MMILLPDGTIPTRPQRLPAVNAATTTATENTTAATKLIAGLRAVYAGVTRLFGGLHR